MALKTFNPTSPGRRQLVLVDRSELHKGKPVKALTEGLTKKGGRNNKGRITARRIGGGAKKLYRKVDFKRNRWDIPATVERLEYDPNRTAFIALIKYEDGQLSYIIAPQRLEVGDTVITSATADIKPGNTLPLKSIPVGTIIHNIELKPQKAYGDGYLPGNRRCCVQPGQHEPGALQGWPQTPPRQAPVCPWCRDEPGRPPARWW